MKKSLGSLALLCLLCVAGVPGPNGTWRVVLGWDAPTNQNVASLTYRIYGTTNIATPTNQWLMLTNFPGTNATPLGSQLLFPIYVPQPDGNSWFFTMTASNRTGFWGETPFSSAAVTPPAPPLLNNLTVSP